MASIGSCCKCAATLVLVAALLLGLLLSGTLSEAGVFALADQFWSPLRGDYPFMGMFPAVHVGTPWGFTLDDMPDLTGEVALVTGGNTGLGFWTAYYMASKGARVTIGCRSSSKCSDAAAQIQAQTGKAVSTASLDVSSLASVRSCAAAFGNDHPRLDILVLNAGVMWCEYALTVDGLETQMATNHFGHFLLTKLLMPQIEAAAAAKGVATVVSVSSVAHGETYRVGILPTLQHMNDAAGYDKWKAYGQSKLANVLFAQELAERVRDKNILVNSLHPGIVGTELWRHSGAQLTKLLGASTVEYLSEKVTSQAVWHPRDAALTQLYAAVGPRVREEKITGKYFAPIARETLPHFYARNATLQKLLWDLSEAAVSPK